MKRSKPLHSNPEATRAWQQRSRKARQRPRQPLSPGKRRYKVRIPPNVRRAVLQRQEGRCIVPGCKRRPAHWHHILDEAIWPEVAKHPDNGVLICPQDHDNHSRAHRRIAREWLPRAALDLTVRLGPRAESFIERTYPVIGAEPGGTGSKQEEATSG